ncbi:MAG: aminotransferase class III-fold pyridoxal phosphate-dependent enzyme [bacterium]|nr:aminotransferase class III-fold pyridoxal phosphate-dependent enzyme [bacterium]
MNAVAEAIDDETCAILIEPIQGEGGVRIAGTEFLQGLRDLADENDLLLMFDEVQCGSGRTGEWFAYQHFGVTPDVMTLAKSVCGGIAGGAMLTTAEIAPSLRPGMHAATFGGNPIAARAGIATLEMIESEGLLSAAGELETRFKTFFTELQEELSIIREVRVLGAMVGVELDIDGAPIVSRCLEKRLLINCTQGTVIRLLPALNLSAEDAEAGCEILAEVLREASQQANAEA